MWWIITTALAVIAIVFIWVRNSRTEEERQRRLLQRNPSVFPDFNLPYFASTPEVGLSQMTTSPPIPESQPSRGARPPQYNTTPEIRLGKRGVGICTNTVCPAYGRGSFLLNHNGPFFCPDCRLVGKIVHERGEFINKETCIRAVRVEFDYQFHSDSYAGMAMVWDSALKEEGTNTYILYSPLIRTKERALKVAESLIASLQRVPSIESVREAVIRNTQMTISFDVPLKQFEKACKELSANLKTAELRRSNKLR